MSNTIENLIFNSLRDIGVRRAFGPRQVPPFTGTLNRNGIQYEIMDQVTSLPEFPEIPAFVTSSDYNDLSSCCTWAAHYIGDGPAVFIVEHGNAHGSAMPYTPPNLTFGAVTVIDNPATAAWHIHNILDFLVRERRPVYIGVPRHIATLPLSTVAYSADEEGEENAANAASAMLYIF
ncbi:hypothetical protein BU24DRAFT_459807 [Aaosphaeria arxii CBS 175.79]|uniref:Thiamine pyrophosphate enzyme N-terminal TPP-binding domain-containing protein n=1 Tax=Aaosphaeria arxii CBS 175.79 TaxID=1450172 RepID=A0A6A5Y3T6_9PLEO|nr:uncharacterized protein BU24DRAFT_459807 [Aaosphaeria arxii CBS 175.79]KAF2020202.1 hypothetical protein BU24DRAFT_459807 [Aaosphaeria arxii CBS 175.79]